MIPIEKIKKLREETLVSISQCKKALEETEGDIEKAKELLRKWGTKVADKKSGREVNSGIVESYIHPNKRIGVLIDIRCESDFVAKSEQFQKLAHEICLQIAASKPLFLKEEDISEEFLHGEKKIYLEQFKESGKPENIINDIIEGKLKKYKEEISLLNQAWIKNPDTTIKDLINEQIGKIGENVVLKSFTRYEI